MHGLQLYYRSARWAIMDVSLSTKQRMLSKSALLPLTLGCWEKTNSSSSQSSSDTCRHREPHSSNTWQSCQNVALFVTRNSSRHVVCLLGTLVGWSMRSWLCKHTARVAGKVLSLVTIIERACVCSCDFESISWPRAKSCDVRGTLWWPPPSSRRVRCRTIWRHFG